MTKLARCWGSIGTEPWCGDMCMTMMESWHKFKVQGLWLRCDTTSREGESEHFRLTSQIALFLWIKFRLLQLVFNVIVSPQVVLIRRRWVRVRPGRVPATTRTRSVRIQLVRKFGESLRYAGNLRGETCRLFECPLWINGKQHSGYRGPTFYRPRLLPWTGIRSKQWCRQLLVPVAGEKF